MVYVSVGKVGILWEQSLHVYIYSLVIIMVSVGVMFSPLDGFLPCIEALKSTSVT